MRRAAIVGSLDATAIEAEILDNAPSTPTNQPEIRKGSPFAKPAPDNGTRLGAARKAKAPPKSPAAYSAPKMAGAVSVPLAIFALVLAYSFPAGSLGVAGAAIGFGIWGLYCPKPGLGTAGVVFACIALAMAAFFGTIELYEYLYGVNPFSPATPPPILNP